MKKTETNGSSAQGVDEPITVKTIEGYLKKDLQVAISCLEAMHSDPDLLRAMADFMHGRYLNNLNKKEVEKQEKV